MSLDKKKSILFAAGGTGGHLFPAQALASDLLLKNPSLEILFSGAGLSTNRYFDREKFAFVEVTSSTPFQRSILKTMKSLFSLARGIKESCALLEKTQPALVIGFGSFHAFPLLCAAKLKKIPLILFESNAEPGKVIRLFSTYAIFTGIAFEAAQKQLKGKSIDVFPPRKHKKTLSKAEACQYFGLDPNLPILLVFGGSQGAKKINETLLHILPSLKNIQLIHLTGSDESAQLMRNLCTELNLTTSIKSFESNMEMAWSAADLVVCRAGAATLTELIDFEVPGILIPYPHASDQHQLKNALFMQAQVGGTVHIEEASIDPHVLIQTIEELLLTKDEMANKIRSYKQKQNKQELASCVMEFLNHGH